MIVSCELEEFEAENDYGHSVESVRATCSQCQHETESFGTGEASIKRCLALLREECPRGRSNFYVAPGYGEGALPRRFPDPGAGPRERKM